MVRSSLTTTFWCILIHWIQSQSLTIHLNEKKSFFMRFCTAQNKINMLWSNLQFVIYKLFALKQTICSDNLWQIMVVWHLQTNKKKRTNKWLQIAVQRANTERMRNSFDYSKHVAAWTCTPAHTLTQTHGTLEDHSGDARGFTYRQEN